MATATADIETAPAPEAVEPRSKRTLILSLAAAAVIGAGGIWYITHHGLENTDNAQIDGDVVAVPARVGGVVTKIASPQITGVLVPHSGNGHFHIMLRCSCHTIGTPFSALTAVPSGPLHCGQSAAKVPDTNRLSARIDDG